MRALGDKYARDEFRLHKEGNTTDEQWTEFGNEWRKYLSTIRGEIVGGRTGELSTADLSSMTPEQLEQLKRLEREALSMGQVADPEINKK